MNKSSDVNENEASVSIGKWNIEHFGTNFLQMIDELFLKNMFRINEEV